MYSQNNLNMLSRRLFAALPNLHYNNTVIQHRDVHVSVIGAGSTIGSNLALLLKQNTKVTKLKLHDFDHKVVGIAEELNQMPGGPRVVGFAGADELKAAITLSKLIIMVSRMPRAPTVSRNDMLKINAPKVQKLCQAMSERNPEAFLAISTSPINAILPFACAMLFKYQIFNPFRVFGITHIDTARTRCFAATYLNANPRHISVPVIGGHSEDTMVPLFSNMTPNFYTLDAREADKLTRMVKRAGTDVINSKSGTDSATLAMSWAINEFAEKMIDALWGNEVEVHSYTANPHFGTRFFAGPNTVGPYGIVRTCSNFAMSNLECNLLSDAVPHINKDIALGEELSRLYD